MTWRELSARPYGEVFLVARGRGGGRGGGSGGVKSISFVDKHKFVKDGTV